MLSRKCVIGDGKEVLCTPRKRNTSAIPGLKGSKHHPGALPTQIGTRKILSLTYTLLLRRADRQRGWCCFRKHSAVTEHGMGLPVWFPQVYGHFLGFSESEWGTGPVTWFGLMLPSESKPQKGDQERAKLEGQWWPWTRSQPKPEKMGQNSMCWAQLSPLSQ